MFKDIALNIVFSLISTTLRGMDTCTLDCLMVAFGKAFGPKGCRHFSELTPDEQEELLARAPILRENHRDWPKAFRWVPRRLTAYVMPDNMPPPILDGTGTIEDIPEPGTYVIVDGYLALTTIDKWHIRFGFRWDRNDLYLEFPSFTIKRLR